MKQALLHYDEGTYDILELGDYVTCAVTGRSIPLESLRYWSADLQEAYVDAQAAFSRLKDYYPSG